LGQSNNIRAARQAFESQFSDQEKDQIRIQITSIIEKQNSGGFYSVKSLFVCSLFTLKIMLQSGFLFLDSDAISLSRLLQIFFQIIQSKA